MVDPVTYGGLTIGQWLFGAYAAESLRKQTVQAGIEAKMIEEEAKRAKERRQEAAAQRAEGVQDVQTESINEIKPLAMGSIFDALAADTSNNQPKKTSNIAASGGIGTGYMV